MTFLGNSCEVPSLSLYIVPSSTVFSQSDSCEPGIFSFHFIVLRAWSGTNLETSWRDLVTTSLSADLHLGPP